MSLNNIDLPVPTFVNGFTKKLHIYGVPKTPIDKPVVDLCDNPLSKVNFATPKPTNKSKDSFCTSPPRHAGKKVQNDRKKGINKGGVKTFDTDDDNDIIYDDLLYDYETDYDETDDETTKIKMVLPLSLGDYIIL